MILTKEKMNAFLDKNKISSICRECGHDGGSIPFNGEFIEYSSLDTHVINASSEVERGTKYQAVNLVCNNCGYIRQFMLVRVMENMGYTE